MSFSLIPLEFTFQQQKFTLNCHLKKAITLNVCMYVYQYPLCRDVAASRKLDDQNPSLAFPQIFFSRKKVAEGFINIYDTYYKEISWLKKKYIAGQETSVSRHNYGPIKCPSQTPHYDSVVMVRGVSSGP